MPAVHCTAVTHDVAPATTLVLPAAHTAQLEPVPLYPGAHRLHDAAEVEPVAEVVKPVPHIVHAVLPADALYDPTAHAVHVTPSPP
jgi:hypothetical protein